MGQASTVNQVANRVDAREIGLHLFIDAHASTVVIQPLLHQLLEAAGVSPAANRHQHIFAGEGLFTFVGLGQNVGADVDVLSHEVNEWLNDPFLVNIVPDWSYSVPPLIPSACSDLLEPGDPLELVNFPEPLNGFTYHLQDAALFSYFTRQSPSIGYQGRYTFLGTLPSYSTPCG